MFHEIFEKQFFTYLILLFSGEWIVFGEVTFTASSVSVAENSSLELTCSYNGNKTVQLFTMTLNQTPEGILQPDCSVFAKQPDTSMYTYVCPTNKQLKWTIKKVTRTNEGNTWTCEVSYGGGSGKASYNISVYVPVQSVTLTSPQDNVVTVQENKEVVFICTTSGGLPEATIRWYKMQTPAASDVAITNLVTVTTKKTSDDLVSVTSTLRFFPTKSENGIRIYCTANNSANIVVSARKPELNVQYPPELPTIPGFSNGSTYKVIEIYTGTLSCSIEGGNPLANLSWDCFNVGAASVTVGTKVTRNVTWTATRDQDRTCTCQSSHIVAGDQDVFVRVEVLYPPDKPIFKINGNTVSGPASFIEGQTRRIVCVGNGKPSPNIYSWINGSKTVSDEAVLTLNNIKKTDDGEYSCEVKNTMIPTSAVQKTGTNTSVVKVIVLFAPSSPIFFYGNLNGPQITRNSIDVVRGETFAIACKSDAKPTPAYRWSGQTSDDHILSVTSINEHDSLSRTCTATNTMRETYGSTRDGSSQRNLTFNVLYPPSINSCMLSYTPGSSINVAGSVAVLEGSSFSLTCATSSNPAVDSYSWSGPIMSSSAVLDISSINRGQNGTFTLTAVNSMVKTFGGSVPGKDTKNISFDILYAPTVRPLANQDIIAGSQLNLSCPVIKGNPAVTTFKWTRNDSMAWNQQILYIRNVTRHDDMIYTCTVQNTMKPTGASQQNGKGNGSFHLNVLYRATVTSFFIQDYEDNPQSIFTVNENDTLPMKCVVESNPGSQIDLLFNNTILKSKGDTTDIVFSEKMAFCSDAGVYTCSAKNQYNDGIPSIKTFTLNVRCSPRPLGPVNTTIFSARRVEAYFNFTGLAYPVPPPSNFIWKKKEENTVWKTLSNSSTTRIFISGLFTYLKLTNVSQSDYGEYRLIITNTVGNYTQTFHLEPEGVPEVPSELRIVEKFVTETSALLQWKPAFNGGPEQTFTIMYKKSSEQKWVNITVTDTGEATMNYTLSPLDSGSQYTVIISSHNKVGESAGSRNATFITKALRGSSSVALIGGAVGGGIGCALVITFIVLLVLRFRRNKGNSKKQDKKDDRKPVYKDEDDYGMQDNPMYVSAGPRDEAQSASKNTSDGSAAVYSTVDKAKTAVSGAGNDVYVYDKTKKKKQGKPDKSKPGILLDKKGKKHNQGGDIYENASTTELKVKKKKNDDNIYENPEPRKKFEKKNVNKDGLIYADLAFNDQPKGQKKLIIHGIEDITEYVTVDFTKKADPLPDSDDENCTPKK